jgi:predicted RNA-binding Zn-ribbon protein involved in translation (DUF1610 family)
MTAAPIPAGHAMCPNCGKEMIRPAREGGVLLKSRSHIVIDPVSERALLTCPRCDAQVELRKGTLLLFRSPAARRRPDR